MAKFEVSQRVNGEFQFNLKADNGKVILTSEGYKAKASAYNGVESVRKNAPDAERYDVMESKDGQCYFTLKAGNNEVIGTSEMYVNFDNANEGIARVKELAPTAELDDMTV